MAMATYDDVIKAPEDKIAELVAGELYLSPRPRIRHSRVLGTLHSALYGEFQQGARGSGGWWILIEPEIHLGEDVFVPDLVGWRTTTLPLLPDEAWIDVAPDWVCEILSPSTRLYDVQLKLPAYAIHGVSFAWVVDPEARTFESLTRRGVAWERSAQWTGNVVVSAVPFDATPIDLASLWR